jgi:hypothetical protein
MGIEPTLVAWEAPPQSRADEIPPVVSRKVS